MTTNKTSLIKLTEDSEEMICSNCCHFPLEENSDLCIKCGRHCVPVIECPECNGKGYYDVIDASAVREWTIDEPYKKEICDRCKGEGEIESSL